MAGLTFTLMATEVEWLFLTSKDKSPRSFMPQPKAGFLFFGTKTMYLLLYFPLKRSGKKNKQWDDLCTLTLP